MYCKYFWMWEFCIFFFILVSFVPILYAPLLFYRSQFYHRPYMDVHLCLCEPTNGESILVVCKWKIKHIKALTHLHPNRSPIWKKKTTFILIGSRTQAEISFYQMKNYHRHNQFLHSINFDGVANLSATRIWVSANLFAHQQQITHSSLFCNMWNEMFWIVNLNASI